MHVFKIIEIKAERKKQIFEWNKIYFIKDLLQEIEREKTYREFVPETLSL